jgi:hypothetical protein
MSLYYYVRFTFFFSTCTPFHAQLSNDRRQNLLPFRFSLDYLVVLCESSLSTFLFTSCFARRSLTMAGVGRLPTPPSEETSDGISPAPVELSEAEQRRQKSTLELLLEAERKANDAIEQADDTNAQLGAQAETMHRVDSKLDDLEFRLGIADRLVKGIISWTGAVSNWLSCAPERAPPKSNLHATNAKGTSSGVSRKVSPPPATVVRAVASSGKPDSRKTSPASAPVLTGGSATKQENKREESPSPKSPSPSPAPNATGPAVKPTAPDSATRLKSWMKPSTSRSPQVDGNNPSPGPNSSPAFSRGSPSWTKPAPSSDQTIATRSTQGSSPLSSSSAKPLTSISDSPTIKTENEVLDRLANSATKLKGKALDQRAAIQQQTGLLDGVGRKMESVETHTKRTTASVKKINDGPL